MTSLDPQVAGELTPSLMHQATLHQDEKPHLVWVFSAVIADRLDSATWLDTTDELRKMGWDVTLIGMGPAGTQFIRGIEVTCVPPKDAYFLKQVSFHVGVLRLLLQQWDAIDIILFHQNSGIWLLPLRLLRWLQGNNRPQIVMDTRDLNDSKAGSVRVKLRNAYMRLNHHLVNMFADGQTTITSRFVNLVDIPEPKLWGIWPSGVNPEPFTAAAEARVWPRENDPVKLVYIGMMLEKRHPLQLCRAVNAALKQGRNFELYFYGDGPEAAQVRRCADKSNGQIKVMPPIAHEKVPQMLAQMHVGVTSLPDVDDEKYAASSPVKLFEYMASGLPLLATKSPCHIDVVADGSFAFWIDEPTEEGIRDGLEKIWASRDSLNRLSSEAQAAVDLWTWEAAAAKLDDALKYGLRQLPADQS